METLPLVELGWGIFTLLQYRVQSYSELMAYRFFVGLFEAAYLPAIHFVLGSWYRRDEYGRRGGLFYIGQTLGILTASLIQAGTSARLDGVHGLAGWRWNYSEFDPRTYCLQSSFHFHDGVYQRRNRQDIQRPYTIASRL